MQQEKARLLHLENSLRLQAALKINQLKQRFAAQLATLHAVSPLATLDRGYAIATCHKKVILDSQLVSKGDLVTIRLAKGELKTKVMGILNA